MKSTNRPFHSAVLVFKLFYHPRAADWAHWVIQSQWTLSRECRSLCFYPNTTLSLHVTHFLTGRQIRERSNKPTVHHAINAKVPSQRDTTEGSLLSIQPFVLHAFLWSFLILQKAISRVSDTKRKTFCRANTSCSCCFLWLSTATKWPKLGNAFQPL